MKQENKAHELFFLKKNDIVPIINEAVASAISEENEKLINEIKISKAKEQLLNLDQFATSLTCSKPTARNIAVGFNIKPHVYDENANPIFLLSEIIQGIKNGPAPKWFNQRRGDLLKKLQKANLLSQ